MSAPGDCAGGRSPATLPTAHQPWARSPPDEEPVLALTGSVQFVRRHSELVAHTTTCRLAVRRDRQQHLAGPRAQIEFIGRR